MKRIFYIIAFMFLGLLVTQLVHAALEIPTLHLVANRYDVYGDSFVWQNWRVIHGVGGKLLSLAGLLTGFFLGRKFWQILYVEKRSGQPYW
ncbi:MAG: hypothetical protein A3G09_02955 [Candidatus Moranbacteria bacterium RIFCSPLOWO2_12_FULL_48_12]|nr:MAG: hypothetical protein A3G09_02955 [Candidatus Moranbacteria bacterium RIFCSPLOWO2_12_FULL_48_12]